MIDYHGQTIEYYFNGGWVDHLWKEMAEWHSGCMNLGLYLQLIDGNATTYTITASFAGDQPVNATAYDNTLGGASYAECTTIQYDYEPSSNTTLLIVTPQSTQSAMPTGTPTQMEQQAESNGSLNIWVTLGGGLFTWCKTHVMVNVGSLNLTISAWVGFPTGAGVDQCSGFQNVFLDAFSGVANSSVQLALGALISAVATAVAAFAAGWMATVATGGPANHAYWIALGVYLIGMAGQPGRPERERDDHG
jgi:hypothetical protein